jgi:hypothetical protein
MRRASCCRRGARTACCSVRRGRQDDFDQRSQAAAAFAGTAIDDVVFTADDLVLGYRIDGKLRGRDWQSLNVRNAQHPFSRDGATPPIGRPGPKRGTPRRACRDPRRPDGRIPARRRDGGAVERTEPRGAAAALHRVGSGARAGHQSGCALPISLD